MADKPNYDLMVLLDPEAPEERRAELIEQIRAQIQSGDATLKGDADWGMRRLAYEIDHRVEAQYHLFQFEASPDVLNSLDRSLSIEDAVLRFRTIRLPGEAPDQTPQAPPQTSFESGRREGREGRGRDGRDDRGERRGPETPTEDAPPASEAVEAPAAETPAEAPAVAPAEAPAEAAPAVPAEAAPEAAPEAAAVAPEAAETPASEQPSQGEPPPENA
jgi:small subunit ribosomal protein S6